MAITPRRELNEDADHPSESSLETAILYALGALPEAAARAFEEHLESGCTSCAREKAEFSHLVAELGQAASRGAPPPPPALKELFLKKIQGEVAAEDIQVWKTWNQGTSETQLSGMFMQHAGEGEWQNTADSGVYAKPLFIDKERNYVTMLVRMDPGTSYPSHRHAGAEECYVLEGDLKVGDHVLRAGDYQRAEANSLHGVQSTEKGCLLFIVSSQGDELI